MKPIGPRIGLLVLLVLLGREAGAADDALRSTVVRIEVEKMVSRRTGAGNVSTEKERYVGSGFWAAGTNRIVTCAHVLHGARKVSVTRFNAPGGQTWTTDKGEVSLCLSDPAHDLAVIQVPEVGLALPLSSATVSAQAPVRSMGHTENYPWRLNEGRFTGKVSASTFSTPLQGDILVCDISFGPGSSGGVVVDGQNRIIGMIQGGSSGGIYGTKIAIPAAVIENALRTLPAQPCGGGLITPGSVIAADANSFSDLISLNGAKGEEFAATYWFQGAYGVVAGTDQFDDLLPALRLEVLRSAGSRLSWSLRGTVARRTVQRTVHVEGYELNGEARDEATIQRVEATVGPRMLLKEFGRVSLYSSVVAGYVHDRIDHDYTFPEDSILGPQSHERTASGIVGEASLEADVPIVLNLRLGLTGAIWQGSGDIGNGVFGQVGLRFGVGRVVP